MHIFYISQQAKNIAHQLHQSMEHSIWHDGQPIKHALIQAFQEQQPIICVASPAIIIRILAPFLHDKRHEPPVLCVDEQASYIMPLLGYHHGGREHAMRVKNILGGNAHIIHTGSCRHNTIFDTPPKGYALSNPHISNNILGKLARHETVLCYNDSDDNAITLPNGVTPTNNNNDALMRISRHIMPDQLGLHPKDIHIGIGLERHVPYHILRPIIDKILHDNAISWPSVATINSVSLKMDEPALWQLWRDVQEHDIYLRFHEADMLQHVKVANPSPYVQDTIGTPSVAEASALLQAGDKGTLCQEKHKEQGVTIALAKSIFPFTDDTTIQGTAIGLLHVIGLGPGNAGYRTHEVTTLLHECDIIVSYGYYADLVHDIIANKPLITHPLGQEKERVHDALYHAAQGKKVGLLASGDAGMYALAMLALEYADKTDDRGMKAVPIITSPGISAFQLLAAKLGAPAGNDCAIISLSSIMTPKHIIQQRLKAAAMGEFVTFLYNPRSKTRHDLFHETLEIFRTHYHKQGHDIANIFVAIGRQLGRDNEQVTITNLHDINEEQVDMFSIVMIANHQTQLYRHAMQNYLYAPRGYLDKA